MTRFFGLRRHCTLAFVAIIVSSATAWAQDGVPAANFQVFLSGRAIGTEQVTVTRSDDGWSVAGSGRLEAPVNLDTQWFQVRYDVEERPLAFEMDAVQRGNPLKIRVSFVDRSARAEVTRDGEDSSLTDPTSERPIVLSDTFFAAYEAMTQHLTDLEVGAEFPVYFAAQGEIMVRVDRILDERIQTPARTIPTRRYQMTFLRPNGPFGAEVWSDDHQRLLRLSLPAAGIEILREDIATVNARRQTLAHAGDEEVRIPATGFSLAATLSSPGNDQPRRGHPAVVIVPSSTAQDRDDAVGGVPQAGLLAHALVDAGYVVVRYDKRGVAQSGGRLESAGVGDYAEDVRAAFKYLERRKDVDKDRIGVIGRGDAGAIALQVASREKRVAWLVLIGTASVPGADLVLEQQAKALESLPLSLEEKEQRIDLQKRIAQAVMTGEGWEGIAPEVRRQANTSWFRSFLRFDPAEAMERTRQPILILQPGLDAQLGPGHGDRLAEMALARKRNGGVELVDIAGVDHRLAASSPDDQTTSGLEATGLAPEVVGAITTWLTSSAAMGRR